MENFLLYFFDKDFNSIRHIKSLEELKSWVANEEILNRKNKRKKFKNQRMRLLDFDKNFTKEETNSELFLIFNKIFSLNLSFKIKEEFVFKVLNLYRDILTKEEIVLFLTSYWHINGSTWHDFYFLFSIWLKFLETEVLEITEKSIELIWFQDALLNINTEDKFINFLLDIPEFIKIISLPYYLFSESLSYVNKKPDHFKDDEFVISENIINSVINQFCKYENTLLENIFIDLLAFVVDISNINNVDKFTTILRENLGKWIKKNIKSLNRIMYFIHQIWQKRLISFSHFLEFTFFIGKNIGKRKNNLYVNYVIKIYQQSFLQINQVTNLINDSKITALLSYKTKLKLFQTFEAKPEIFNDLEFIKFYFKLKNSYNPFINNLNNYFQITFSNELTWQSFISFFITQTKKRKENLLNSLIKYLKSNQYNIQSTNFADGYNETLEKVNILATNNDNNGFKYTILEKMYKMMDNDERYSALLPSLILNFFELFTDETYRNRSAQLVNKYLQKLNPLTMNGNYYRMFLRDSYKIALRNDYVPKIRDELNQKLERFLESYIHYGNNIIQDKEKIEFLEYLTTFSLSNETTNKIVNWVNNQPNLNVRILTTIKKSNESTNESLEFTSTQQELVLNDVKCGSCLREIKEPRDKKSCDYCDITLCLTCFIEFEFSGENCPGVLFGNKMHKFKIKNK